MGHIFVAAAAVVVVLADFRQQLVATGRTQQPAAACSSLQQPAAACSRWQLSPLVAAAATNRVVTAAALGKDLFVYVVFSFCSHCQQVCMLAEAALVAAFFVLDKILICQLSGDCCSSRSCSSRTSLGNLKWISSNLMKNDVFLDGKVRVH